MAPSKGLPRIVKAMQHILDLSSIQLDGCGLAIGSFDGVHRGHQALVQAMVSNAREVNLPSAVLTFYPHPSAVLSGRRPALYITSPDEKAVLLGDFGVDYVITQHFDRKFSKVSAGVFLDRLQSHLDLKHLWIGEDFALGYKREGDRQYLELAGVKRGFQLYTMPPVNINGETVSSTRIRDALRAGDVASVANFLGRSFTIPGEVVIGSNRGKQLGFPTANLCISEDRVSPGPGVYACLAEAAGQTWKAVANIGTRPTFEENQEFHTIEAHLLGFNGDLYRQTLVLSFIDRLRDEKRFSGPETLISQIKTDIQDANEILDPMMEADDG
jgi:riboflavin kinase/FMN adenylyltransferase